MEIPGTSIITLRRGGYCPLSFFNSTAPPLRGEWNHSELGISMENTILSFTIM